MTETSTQTRAGFVAILGAPNAGKSTLLNQLIGEKLSIVTRKAQTTRIRILGLLTEGDTQMGLIDTPGLFQPQTRLDRAMVRAAWESLDGADAVLFIVDASARMPDARCEAAMKQLAERKKRHVILALNKVDKIARQKLLPLAAQMDASGLFEKIYMISALNGDGVSDLKQDLLAQMPVGPWPYPEDQLTDVSERLLAAEITREQILLQLNEELPYVSTVMPEAWDEHRDGSVVIRQTIMVERPNHRAIVLGKNGARIKAISQAAREEMAEQFGRPVHLFLEVKADEKWQDKPEYYRLFGLNPRGSSV